MHGTGNNWKGTTEPKALTFTTKVVRKSTERKQVMGMAASQARFLGLTARKTNVEYEGQQINQQRTTLSNQTANYYNQLLGMSVPVPPSVEDYTKTVYTFKDGALNNSISSMIAQGNGEYLISYTSSWTDDFAAVAAATSIVTRENIGNLKYNGKNLMVGNTTDGVTSYYYLDENNKMQTIYSKLDGEATKWYSDSECKTEISKNKLSEAEEYSYRVGSNPLRNMQRIADTKAMTDEQCEAFKANNKDGYIENLSNDQIRQLLEEENNYLDILQKQYGGTDNDWTVRYVQNTTTGTWSPYFCKKSVLESDNTVYSDNGASLSNIPMYTIGSAQKTEEVKGITARFEQDATGRLISVTLKPGEEDQVTYAVTTNTITDQAKYDDAMNQYEYDKYQYDQSIQEINAKIEIIQSEDKNLELRLKQLDTEQDAISTEMDAVQKVIEKNTESTFKTFG